MFRNQYDLDPVTWNPKGQLLQVSYAVEAVKQGSVALGLKSNQHVVIVTLKRRQNDLAGYQEKVFRVDDHMGIAISGLTADARHLCKYLRNECLNYAYVYDGKHPISRLIFKISEKSQHRTMTAGKRPFGVGLLVAGVDDLGTHLYETSPDGNYYEFFANAIGARSQSAKTYLEKNFESFPNATVDELIVHGLKALRNSSQETELDEKNVSVGVVGINTPFRSLDSTELQHYIGSIREGQEKMEIST